MAGLSLLVVADSTSVVAFGLADQRMKGLAGVFNQDRHDCVILNSPTQPSIFHLHAQGAWLGPFGDPQAQVQELNEGMEPDKVWIGCTPFTKLNPGGTVDAQEDIYPVNPDGDTHSYVATNFVVPVIGATVSIEVVNVPGASAHDFDSRVGNYVDRGTGLGCAIAGLLWDLVSVDDDTHITVRNTGLPCAVVTAYG